MTACTKFKILPLCIIFCIQFTFAQTRKNADDFLVPDKNNLPSIFLVGTFHFQYYNLDAHKTEKDKQVDIFSDQKQKELKELLDYIALFKPTKIVIEAGASWEGMKKYREYKSGTRKLDRDERYQVAFRLMDRFKLDTLYAADAGSISNDLMYCKDSTTVRPYMNAIFKDYAFRSNENYNNYFDYLTSLSTEIPLLSYFNYINSEKNLQRIYGAYLLGDFKLGKYEGADALATDWYDRNLRIFRNIQQVTTSANDRILVLFGYGHIAILDQLFSCSPEYNYIQFNDLKK